MITFKLNSIGNINFSKYLGGFLELVIIILIICLYLFAPSLLLSISIILLLIIVSLWTLVKPYYLVGIIFIELAFGGAGRWLVLPGGISIRILLYILPFMLSIFLVADNKRKWLKSTFNLPTILMGILLPSIWGLGIAFFNGNNISYILDDCNGQLFFLSFFPFYILLQNRAELTRVIDLFLVGIFSLALFNNITYLLLILGVLDIEAVNSFVRLTQIGKANFIVGIKIFRLYFGSAIFWQIGLSIVTSRLLFDSQLKYKKLYYLFILIVSIALLTSFTRGFWIGALLSLIWLFYKIEDTNKKIKIIIISMLMLIFIESLVNYYNFSLFSFFWDRLISSFDFTSDISVNYRILQLSQALTQISQNPFWGAGYGGELIGFPGYALELGYLDLLLKLGIIGFSIWLLAFVYIMASCLKITKNIKNGKDIALALGLIGGMIGLVFTSGTNPFIMGSLGISYITLTMVSFEIMRQKYESQKS